MHKLKQTVRTTLLYISTVVLVGGVPMSAYADKTDACLAAGIKNANWTTHPVTGECVKKSDIKKEQKAQDQAQQSQAETPSSETPAPVTEETTADVSGDDSAATTNQNTNVSTDTNVNNSVDVTNNIAADTTSGDAKVIGNESSGSSTTGDAITQTTVINSVHSTVGGDTQGVAHFTADINGNVVGDITIGPAIDGATANSTTNLDSKTNVNNDTSLTNNVNSSTTSGDATVAGNKSSGDATSGNVHTVADILNLINTIIAANKSFVGTINIYGNLDGDILISPEFIPQLLASNASSNSVMNLSTSLNVNDDQSIINNVELNAASGTAAVRGNDTSGSATSGTAATNLTILNLTGHEVNAANSLLVFVNVLGKWIGMIVDAPGATAAALGNGVTNSSINASSQANLNNTSAIVNNVNLASQTGDASVTGNGSAGSATTGNATASANIANISTSTFNLTDWFGVLYINVFGTWIGSFGIDTAAGTVAPLTGDAVAMTAPTDVNAPNLRFGFRPASHSIASAAFATTGGTGTTLTPSDDGYGAAVLASTQLNKGSSATGTGTVLRSVASPRSDPFSIIMMTTGFGIVAASAAMWVFRRWQESHSMVTGQ